MGFVVIMTMHYYLLWPSRAMAFSGKISRASPLDRNIVFGAAASCSCWRAGLAEQQFAFRFRASGAVRRMPARRGLADRPAPTSGRGGEDSRFDLPSPRLLDAVRRARNTAVFLLGFAGLLGVFYISTLMEMADR
jgi:hypothetical protein